ncbi:MAG: hypothetical protein H6810_08660 [Phycisphaeraceae bacterium]|nr:MAG: hypothetical protein H6810_08660 [Phycisphaeraceae bacterium]
MPKRTPEPGVWRTIARELKALEPRALIEVIADLYEFSPENRAHLAARFCDEAGSSALLDKYKAKITSQFLTRHGPRVSRDPDFMLCRRLIREYRKATTWDEISDEFDAHGAFDLGLHSIETGVAFLRKVDWNEARPYDCLAAVAKEMVEICQGPDGGAIARTFLPRIRALAPAGDSLGYGFCDVTYGLLDAVEEAAGQSAKAGEQHPPGALDHPAE